MKKSRIAKIVLIALLGLFLAACGGAPAASSWPGVTVDEASGTAYVAYNQNVYAVQIDNGVQRWNFRPEGNSFQTYAPPTLTGDGQLLVGGYDKILYSLDPANGSQKWAFAGGGNRYIGSALESAGAIYAPNSDHRLYILSADGALLNSSFSASEPLWSQPASDGSAIYLSAMDHMLYAMDTNGEVLWEQDLGGTLIGSPVLSEDGVIYIGTLNKEILALDSGNGRRIWSFATDGWVWGAPALVEGQIFAGDLEGILYAIDAERGQELWRVTTEGEITGTPLVIGENVYVVNENGDVVSVTIEGTVRWTRNMERPLYGSAVQAGELVLIGMTNVDTIVVALDENGTTVWSFIPAE